MNYIHDESMTDDETWSPQRPICDNPKCRYHAMPMPEGCDPKCVMVVAVGKLSPSGAAGHLLRSNDIQTVERVDRFLWIGSYGHKFYLCRECDYERRMK